MFEQVRADIDVDGHLQLALLTLGKPSGILWAGSFLWERETTIEDSVRAAEQSAHELEDSLRKSRRRVKITDAAAWNSAVRRTTAVSGGSMRST